MLVDLSEEEIEFIARFSSRALKFSEINIPLPSQLKIHKEDIDKVKNLLKKIGCDLNGNRMVS